MADSKQIEKALFDAARNVADAAERSVFLAQACNSDPDLRHRIEGLLAAQTRAEKFFSVGASLRVPLPEDADVTTRTTPANGLVPARDITPLEGPGTRIGPYKLLQRVGEGGCGVVYMAEQEAPVRRRVALKVIKLGMDTNSVIARFEAERQALALMDHPNIARVLDAGATDTGRPYFVMELVRGVRITDYCDQNQLDTRQRLDLFIQICHAIQHAHQKGIIHRDIKPSNILVTLHDGVPVPKVIDFGIAKATTGQRLTDKTLFTAYEQFIGTPAYMSPEQAEMSGLDVDTRSDIYSLGVLLYELLTSKTPFDQKELLQSGLDEMRRTLREKEPHRPSTKLNTFQGDELTKTAEHRQVEPPKLKSLLRGDLDWIVMKALEKDRRRRYETANGLARDIQRHLSNEPVAARPPSRLYQFQKLVHRNQVAFAAAGIVAVALITSLGVSTFLLLKEREARQRAVAAEQQAESARANEAGLRRQAEVRAKITRAALLVSQEKFEEADRLLDEITYSQPTLEVTAVLRALGEWHALKGEWKHAADHFSALLRINQLDGGDVATLDYLECGPALIELGDTAEYDRFRRAAVARFSESPYSFSDRILKVSLLLPADTKLMQSLVPHAELAAKTLAASPDGDSDIFVAAWKSVSLALMEYRQGHYAKAVEWGRRCLAYPEYNAPRTATARVIIAMSRHQLDQTSEARFELAQSRELIAAKFKSGLDRGTGVQGFWFDWVFARILLREASALIEGMPASGN